MNLKITTKNISIKKKFFLYFLLYTFICFIVLSLSFSSFKANNKGFGWAIDSLPVQFPMFTQLKIFVRNIVKKIFVEGSFQIPIYTFNIGMGADVISYLSMWYLEPISFLGVFGGYDKVEFTYDILVLFRLYLAGLSFGVFCFYMKKNKIIPVIIGSLIYVFSGWTFFFVRHPVFFSTLIYLPLLLIGVERIINEKKGGMFSVLVFLSSWTHYYFLYINTIFVGIYFIVRYFDNEKNTKQDFVKKLFLLLKYYILGIGMSMVVFLPNIFTFLNSNRTGMILETGSLWTFGDGWFKKLLLSICGPQQTPGYFLHNGFLPLGILSVLVFVNKYRGKKSISVFAYIIGVLFTLPIFTLALHGFSSIHFRWNYVIGLLAGFSFVYILCDEEKFIFKDYILSIIFVVLYSGTQVYDPSLANNNTIAGTFFLIVSIIMLLYMLIMNKKGIGIECFLLLCVCLNIYVYARLTYDPNYGKYVNEFVEKNSSEDLITDTSASILTNNPNEFYRVDSANTEVKNENANIFLQNYGISSYVNVMDKYYSEFNYGVENCGTRLLDTINNDNRTILEELASVKYFTTYDNQDAYVPYGYTLEQTSTNDHGKVCKVYKNEYALPLGYTYKKSISEQDYNKLDSLEKQESLMQAVVTSSNNSLQVSTDDISLTVQKAEDILISGNNCEYDKKTKKLTVLENGGYLSLEFPAKKNCETYIRLKNLNIDAYKDAYWLITIFNDEKQLNKQIEIRSNTATYSYNCYDHLINLGYSKEGINKINIAFPFASEISLEDIEVLYQPMDSYSLQAQTLKEDEFTNVEQVANGVKGNISIEESKYVVFGIPYSKGWTAYVNGEKVPLERVNITYMGLKLDPGEYSVVLKYMTPGLTLGALISLISIILFIVDMVVAKKKRKYEKQK